MMNPGASRVLDASYGAAGFGAQGISFPMPPVPVAYPGLERLHQEYSRVYPTQPNPLQLKSRLKYWAGGPDPLDYISIYANPGSQDGEIPPHWHYVSFGLSDLYGDARLFPPIFSKGGTSGFGFELTFRLKKDTVNPPVWPGILLQKLAVYCFRTGNPFYNGDHVSWHRSLAETEESRLQHLLVVSDPELRALDGPCGKVRFMQLVGATIEELEAVQHWNGPSFLELMKQNLDCGGRYLITDLRRGESLFELDPGVQEKLTEGIMKDGSTLSGVTAAMSWTETLPMKGGECSSKSLLEEQRRHSSASSNGSYHNLPEVKGRTDVLPPLSDLNTPPRDLLLNPLDEFDDDFEQICRLEQGNGNESDIAATAFGASFIPSTSNSFQRNSNTRSTNAGNQDLVAGINEEFANLMQELSMSIESTKSTHNLVDELLDETVVHETIHLTLNLEAALLIPLMVKGRIRHGRHFTFKCANNGFALTILAPGVSGPDCYADAEKKFASRGDWLQIYLDEELAEKLLQDFEELKKLEMVAFPATIFSMGGKFALTVTL